MDLSGRAAVVTGGAAGIGRACAEALADRGAHVLVVDRDGAAARSVADSIGGSSVAADVGTVAGLDQVRLAADRLADWGVLVNNAGGIVGDWHRIVQVNLQSTLALTQHAIAQMTTGVIVNIASIAGLSTQPHASPAYAAAKAGVVRLTTSLQRVDDVRLAALCPDIVDTPSSRRSRAAKNEAELAALPPVLPPEAVAAAMPRLVDDDRSAGRVLLLRGGEPDLDVTS